MKRTIVLLCAAALVIFCDALQDTTLNESAEVCAKDFNITREYLIAMSNHTLDTVPATSNLKVCVCGYIFIHTGVWSYSYFCFFFVFWILSVSPNAWLLAWALWKTKHWTSKRRRRYQRTPKRMKSAQVCSRGRILATRAGTCISVSWVLINYCIENAGNVFDLICK